MVRAIAVRARSAKPGFWSVAALGLTGAGVIAATSLILAIDSDPGSVRWWLVVAPLGIALAPVLVSGRGIRLAAAVAMGAWCFVALFSIGMLLVPGFLALLAAAILEGP